MPPTAPALATKILGSVYFVDLIKKLGLEESSPEEQEKALSAFGENILARLIFETLSKLTEEQRRHIELVLDKNDPIAFIAHVESLIPQFRSFARSIADDEVEITLATLNESSSTEAAQGNRNDTPTTPLP